jgi:23S rRNA-/tRNA-specific pseudouridylate synthase
LRKRSETRGWWMEAHPEGQSSVTDYRVLGSTQGRGLTWLECRPRTGRTHQIRVHCAGLGCPVLGDPVYGPKDDAPRLPPLHLHARAITVPLYPSRPPITAQATPPDHMLAALRACGWRPDEAAEPAYRRPMRTGRVRPR